ncbi:TrmH family RNA methyltransferase [Croceibacter atlanticus]|uniref:TrmH family RNA methyltransferase n=1 Tax=Croceibacter atlanticus TaxID=313588 RepID=UPI0032B2D64F
MRDQKLLDYLQSYLTPRRQELFKKVLSQRTNHFTVATEDVYQLHNTSAVIRSCDVFGVQNVHIIEEQNAKKIDREIAMGAQKWVTINRYHTVQDSIKSLKGKGYQIVATSPHIESYNLGDFDVSKKSALFFGTERYGLSDEIMKEADCTLKIPMYGFTESLNISVSAAIILQSLAERIRKEDVSWQLNEQEKEDLKFKWLKNNLKNSNELISHFYSKSIFAFELIFVIVIFNVHAFLRIISFTSCIYIIIWQISLTVVKRFHSSGCCFFMRMIAFS